MEVLAFFLILYLRVILITAHGNSLPLTTASSKIEPVKVLPPDKETLILNNFPNTELDCPLSPNLPNEPEIENGAAKPEILLESAASAFSPSSTNSSPNFEEKPTVLDFNPSISQSVGNSLPTFGSNSFTNDFYGARCISNFKALRDSIEAYANLILSSNSVFKLPMAIKSSGDSVSKPFASIPFDSFATPGTFDEPQLPCVQSIENINPHLSFLNFVDSCPSYSQRMIPGFDFPSAIETCESPLVSHSSDLLTHAPCVKSFDTINPDFRLVSDSCQSYPQSMLPLLDFPRKIETFQSPLVSSSQNLQPIFDFPIRNGQSSTLSRYTSPRNFLPTVSSLSTVNLSPNVKFDSFPPFSSSSAFSLPITVNCIDCKSCSLCPLTPNSPTFSVLPVREMIEDCIVSTPNTLAPPTLPKSSSCSLCSSPLTVCKYSPPIFDSFLTDDLISNECPKVPTTSSLPLSTDIESCIISVKNLLPSLNGAKSVSNSLSPVPLKLSSSSSKLPLKTTSFPLLPKSPMSLFNTSFFEIPDLFDNTMFQSLATPLSSTHISPNLSLPSASILTPTPLITPSFSCLTSSSIVPMPLSSHGLPSNRCNNCGSSFVSDQTASDTFSPVPFSNFFNIKPNKE